MDFFGLLIAERLRNMGKQRCQSFCKNSLALLLVLVTLNQISGQNGEEYVYDGSDAQPYIPNNGRYPESPEDYYGYNYGNQQEMTCEQKNSCQGRDPYLKARDVHLVNCFCDDLCQVYDDCCVDFMQTASNQFYEQFKLPRNVFSCKYVDGVDNLSPIYIVDSCPKNYSDAYTKRLCEKTNSGDVFTSAPVTGSQSSILYKNFYCSICNGEEEYSFWDVDIRCDSEQPEVNATDDNFSIDQAIVTLLSSQNHNCSLSFRKEGREARYCKENVISKCSNTWKDKQVKRKCRGYQRTSQKYLLHRIFRNEFCAQCNNINPDALDCNDRITPVVDPDDEVADNFLPPFSLLLDVNQGTGRLKERKVGMLGEEWVSTSIETRQCDLNHIYDPFARQCRLVHCGQGQVYRGGVCVSEASDGEVTTQTSTVSELLSSGSSNTDFLPTPGILHTLPRASKSYLVPGSNPTPSIALSQNTNSRVTTKEPTSTRFGEIDIVPVDCPMVILPVNDYHRVDGDMVYVPMYERVFNNTEYMNGTNGDIMICAPSHERNYTVTVNITQKLEMFKFDRIQGLVSYIGLLISIICLFVVFVIYMVFPVLRNIPGKCVICLVVSLLLAQVSFMLGGPLVDYQIACFILAVLVHFFYLCAFCWMNVLSIDILRMISSTNTRSDEDSSSFIYYSLYAWIVPVVIVGVTLVIEFVGDDISEFKAMYGDGICWITQRWALLILFAAPVALILIINIIIYIVTTVKICLISRATRYLQTDRKDRNNFLLYIKLCLIMGLTWVFGFIAAMTELHFLWYVFIVFNTLQGAFICFAFVCNRNVFSLLSGREKKKKVVATAPYYGNANSHMSNSWNRTKNTVLDTSYNGDARVVESKETSI